MKVTVRYFASVRERLGAQELVEAPAGATAGMLRDMLIALDEEHAAVLGRGRLLRMALNQEMCEEGALVQDGAELAFFPPVTGG